MSTFFCSSFFLFLSSLFCLLSIVLLSLCFFMSSYPFFFSVFLCHWKKGSRTNVWSDIWELTSSSVLSCGSRGNILFLSVFWFSHISVVVVAELIIHWHVVVLAGGVLECKDTQVFYLVFGRGRGSVSDVGCRVFLRMEDITLLAAGTFPPLSFSLFFFLFHFHVMSRNPLLAPSLSPHRVQHQLAWLQC